MVANAVSQLTGLAPVVNVQKAKVQSNNLFMSNYLLTYIPLSKDFSESD